MEEAAQRAAQAIRAAPPTTRWLLASDVDADGLAAAAVMALAFRKLNLRVTLRASRDKSEAAYRALADGAHDGIVLLDKGSSHLPLLASLFPRVVVVDHHNIPATHPDVVLVNPRAEGLDGSRDASAATTAMAVALALCGPAAESWIPTALVGAMGDHQHEGGWQGYNRLLAERALAAGHLATRNAPDLGPDAITAASRHLLPEEATRLVADLALEPGATDLSPEQRTRLASGIVLRSLASGKVLDLQSLARAMQHHVALDVPLELAMATADACGREGQPSTGIAYLMGDRGARKDAQACLAKYHDTIEQAVEALRGAGLAARRALRVAWTQRAEYSGLVASAAVERLPYDPRPVLVLANRPDGRVQASGRGTHAHVAAGMDLGRALAAAAPAGGGEGGGHPVAAGAVVEADRVEAFVAALDETLFDQGFLTRL